MDAHSVKEQELVLSVILVDSPIMDYAMLIVQLVLLLILLIAHAHHVTHHVKHVSNIQANVYHVFQAYIFSKTLVEHHVQLVLLIIMVSVNIVTLTV